MFLKQSTQIVVKVGPYLDKTDGVTEEAGLAGAGTEISKSPGSAFAAGPTLGTHDAEGWYPITLTTSHTDTVGRLVVKGHDNATHLPVWHEFYVLEEAVYDGLFAASATGLLPANVTQWNSVALSTTNPLPNAAPDAAGGLPISDAGGLDLDAKLANTNEVTVARMGALTDWIDGNRLDLLVDAILARMGANTDAATDPSAASGTLFSKIRGAGNDLDTVQNRTKNLWYHVDSQSGSSGGDGTPGSPVDTIGTAITNGAQRIKFLPKSRYNNEGDNDFITLGSVIIPARAMIDFNGCTVEDMQAPVSWASGTAGLFFSSGGRSDLLGSGSEALPQDAAWKNVRFYSGSYSTNYSYFYDVAFLSAVGLTLDDNAGATSEFYGCVFAEPDTEFEITLSGATATTKLNLDECYGNVRISGAKAATRLAYRGWGKLSIDATCNGGAFQISSHIKVYEDDGTTEWDFSNTTSRPTITVIADHYSGKAAATAALDVISTTALARFLTVDTGETTAVAGSVGKIAQGAAGGNVTVEAFTATAVAQLGGISVNIMSFLAAGNQLEIVQGDDYDDTYGHALTLTLSGITEDLTGGSANLYWERGSEQVTMAATSIAQSGTDWIFKFEPASATTAAMTVAGDWRAQLVFTPAATSKRITYFYTRSGEVINQLDD